MINQIHHGDCLELMQHLPAGSVDMILCDLPYGTTACKWDTIIPFDKLWSQYERVIKPNGAIVLTAQIPFDKALGASNLRLLKYEWIWEKEAGTGFLNAKKYPLKSHENILVFSKGTHQYNPQMIGNEARRVTRQNKAQPTDVYNFSMQPEISDYVGRYPKTVLRFNRDKDKLHPTQKPVALFEYLIRTYTNPGEVVLDNCAGSATTAVAAENTGRRWICMEQEEKYVTIGRARVASLQTTLTF